MERDLIREVNWDVNRLHQKNKSNESFKGRMEWRPAE